MPHLSVLLAEDNPDHQDLLRLALAEHCPHAEVRTVETGQKALEALRQREFDCAILDFGLPDTTADQLLTAADRELRACPVLVVSSSTDQGVVVASMRSGSADFIPKAEAVQGDALWRRVEHAISRHRGLRKEKRQVDRRRAPPVPLSETDALTGLCHPRHLERLLGSDRFRDDRRRMSCIMLDVDHLNAINETYGRAAGDEILRAVSGAVRERMRKADAAVRRGGDEFVILRPATTLTDAWLGAEQLRRRVQALRVGPEGRATPATVSLGAVGFATRHVACDVIDRAEQAMHLAKERGRNGVCTWQMVAVERALTLAQSGSDPEERWRKFIAHCLGDLGPTQQLHVTAHSWQVSQMTVRLARYLGMGAGAVERVRIAGLLHDVGKSVIPEDLLAKPDTFSQDERDLMDRHAELGAELAPRLGADAQTADCIRHHHAPVGNGAAGGAPSPVPPEAKVLHVADAFTAMVAKRPHRRAMSVDAALAELKRGAGREYDPEVVAMARYAAPPLRHRAS